MVQPATSNGRTSAAKLKGGYRMVGNLQICMAWWAYHSGLLRTYRDFRVYMALHEVDERRAVENRKRRCRNRPARQFRYGREQLAAEVHALVGGAGGRHVVASLRRLERAGLVTISDSGVVFDSNPDRMPLDDLSGLWTMFGRIDTRKRVRGRSVPIPRSVLRYIAGGCPAVRAATMLGYAIRCLFHQREGVSAEGSCSSSFVAGVFGVHPRNVKRARVELAAMGWLRPLPADHWHVRTHGGRAAIDLSWGSGAAVALSEDLAAGTESPRVRTRIDTGSPPVVSKRELLPESENQEPGRCGPNGQSPDRPSEEPFLRRIEIRDLREPRRTDALLRQAVAAGWVGASVCERLEFHAAAAYALAAGAVNPCGLFVYLTRGHHWDRLTLTAEDTARRNLHALDELSCLEASRGEGECRITTPGRDPERSSAVSTIPPEVRRLVRSLAGRMGTVPEPPARCVSASSIPETDRHDAMNTPHRRPARRFSARAGASTLSSIEKTARGQCGNLKAAPDMNRQSVPRRHLSGIILPPRNGARSTMHSAAGTLRSSRSFQAAPEWPSRRTRSPSLLGAPGGSRARDACLAS